MLYLLLAKGVEVSVWLLPTLDPASLCQGVPHVELKWFQEGNLGQGLVLLEVDCSDGLVEELHVVDW